MKNETPASVQLRWEATAAGAIEHRRHEELARYREAYGWHTFVLIPIGVLALFFGQWIGWALLLTPPAIPLILHLQARHRQRRQEEGRVIFRGPCLLHIEDGTVVFATAGRSYRWPLTLINQAQAKPDGVLLTAEGLPDIWIPQSVADPATLALTIKDLQREPKVRTMGPPEGFQAFTESLDWEPDLWKQTIGFNGPLISLAVTGTLAMWVIIGPWASVLIPLFAVMALFLQRYADARIGRMLAIGELYQGPVEVSVGPLGIWLRRHDHERIFGWAQVQSIRTTSVLHWQTTDGDQGILSDKLHPEGLIALRQQLARWDKGQSQQAKHARRFVDINNPFAPSFQPPKP